MLTHLPPVVAASPNPRALSLWNDVIAVTYELAALADTPARHGRPGRRLEARGVRSYLRLLRLLNLPEWGPHDLDMLDCIACIEHAAARAVAGDAVA
ncbi:MAG TPA: hypothetical protein VMN58_13765 [Acidimicrobiales bacterium]|nr:hypothetical protein [Acidimicrobiales bacterium]